VDVNVMETIYLPDAQAGLRSVVCPMLRKPSRPAQTAGRRTIQTGRWSEVSQ